jgi:hypothetical protein
MAVKCSLVVNSTSQEHPGRAAIDRREAVEAVAALQAVLACALALLDYAYYAYNVCCAL